MTQVLHSRSNFLSPTFTCHRLINIFHYQRIPQVVISTGLNQLTSEIFKNILNDFEMAIEEKRVEINVSQLPVIPAIGLYMN